MFPDIHAGKEAKSEAHGSHGAFLWEVFIQISLHISAITASFDLFPLSPVSGQIDLLAMQMMLDRLCGHVVRAVNLIWY